MLEFLNPYLLRPRLPRFVLLIGDSGSILARVSGGSVLSYDHCAGSADECIAAVSKILNHSPAIPLIVLFDVLGQAYRRDQIPVVNYFDRAKILSRRLELLFPGIEFRGGVSLGASPGGARSIEYLFGSITPTPEVNAWRKLLDTIKNPLDGVRLLPAESTTLIERLINHVSKEAGAVSQWHMLMTQHRTGGFRQIVTRKGQLAMTRMTPGLPESSSPQETVSLLQREIAATIDYITRLGFERAEGLDAVFVGRRGICAELRNTQMPVRRMSAFEPAEAEAIAKLSGTLDPSGHYTDLLHAAWGGGTWLSIMPVLPEEKRKKRLSEVGQRWGARLAIVASVIGLIYGGFLWADISRFRDELMSVEVSLNNAQREYDSEVTKLDEGPVAVDQMQRVLALHRQLDLMHIDVGQIFALLDTVLGDGQRLRSIYVQSLAQSENIIQAALTPAPADQLGQPGQTAAKTIDGKMLLVVDLDNYQNVERAVDEVEQLADKLRSAIPDMQINIRRQPILILPGDTLSITSSGKGLTFPVGARVAEIEMTGKIK